MEGHAHGTQSDGGAPMSARTTIRVRVLNEDYLISGERPPQQLEQAATYVDSLMEHLTQSATNVSPARLAVLAAINLASEVMELRQQTRDLEATIQRRAQHMLTLLEARTNLRCPDVRDGAALPEPSLPPPSARPTPVAAARL
jgi:cell division protein ZapA